MNNHTSSRVKASSRKTTLPARTLVDCDMLHPFAVKLAVGHVCGLFARHGMNDSDNGTNRRPD
jgi:hypothetical protein